MRGRVESRPDGTHGLLQLKDFDDERREINSASVARILPGRISEEQLLRDGDVIFLAKGMRSFAFVPRAVPQPCLVAATFFILRPKDWVLADYLCWALNSESSQRTLIRHTGRGTAMPVVPRETLENLSVPLPDVKKQRLIIEVAALAERERRLLEDLVERKQKLAAALCVRASQPTEESS